MTNQIGRSPYLSRLLLQHQDFAATLDGTTFDSVFADLLRECGSLAESAEETEIIRELRLLKSRGALVVALADLSGHWPVETVTGNLTEFADALIGTALNFLLRQTQGTGKIRVDPRNPSHQCGYAVLAMGKHGAHELNYSSDVDLIVLYDPETAPLAAGVEPSTFFVRLTRNLVALLQDVTQDGYVLRVDLRLRPDPRATQVAIAIEAAAIYYENQGQNWERAAMIKARAAAGDLALGAEFLHRLRPYIWRKYLDFAAIADIQSLKRQIHAVKGHAEIAVRGHNLKLGRGGIREIEFFVQTQQLIAGGRNPDLQGRQTLPMLEALAHAGWITPETSNDMANAYRFLRTLEHRVQMLEDQQDHCVPASDAAFANFACFAGFADAAALEEKLRAVLQTVQQHYQALFESAGELSGTAGNLVFTGGEDDPGTLETLTQLGFRDASEISATIRGWHFGRYAATRNATARERLTELMPQLLKALAATGDADQAFLAFDRYLQGLPAGVQLFSMLKANPHLLDLIARILGTAPRLAQQLSRQPRILEAVLEPGFFGPLPTLAELAALADNLKPPSLLLEEAMDRARVMNREQQFRVGVRILSETVRAEEAGWGFSNLADTMLRAMHAAVTRDMAASHGHLPGGASAIIAMGKLGGKEMAATSDLDLMLVYDCDHAAMSDGKRALSHQQYYSRLTQRLISAVTAPTSEGVLYEVDMRLRPSGSKGPVAVSLASFETYQKESAWTWEKMALTRARIVSADGQLGSHLTTTIKDTLCEKRDVQATRTDIRNMRALMLREHQPANRWDIKRKRGGLVEIEFIAQTLQLIHAHQLPGVLHPNTAEALLALQHAGILDANTASTLVQAHGLYSRLSQVLRLCVVDQFDPTRSTPALRAAVARSAMLPDLPSTEAMLDEVAESVGKIFDEQVGNPLPA